MKSSCLLFFGKLEVSGKSLENGGKRGTWFFFFFVSPETNAQLTDGQKWRWDFYCFPFFRFVCAGVASLFLKFSSRHSYSVGPDGNIKMNEEQNKSGTLRSELISTIIYESFICFLFSFFNCEATFVWKKKKKKKEILYWTTSPFNSLSLQDGGGQRWSWTSCLIAFFASLLSLV
jgi:hypothetical protein